VDEFSFYRQRCGGRAAGREVLHQSDLLSDCDQVGTLTTINNALARTSDSAFDLKNAGFIKTNSGQNATAEKGKAV
jgi:hypothetical protein